MAKTQKVNLIEELTTHKVDYQNWSIERSQGKPDVRPREEPAAIKPPPFVRIDPQSHASYRPSVHVPFDLYAWRKPIVKTDPRECFPGRKKAKRERRIESGRMTTILSPALPLAEIDDENDLRMLLKYTYTRMHQVCFEEAAMKNSKKPDPPDRIPTGGTDLRFKSDLYPKLPEGWLAAANHWDCLQNRKLGDPFRSFWTRKGPRIECSCCCNPLPTMLSEETKEQIRRLVIDDNLRLPYDVTKTGYGGYRQICAKGVPLEKKSAE